MKNLFLIFVSLILVSGVFAQKGVDTQTKTIKEEGNKTTNKGNDVSRTIDFGKEKAKIGSQLSNPYRMNSRRDRLIDTVVQLLAERKMIVDEASSRLNEGLIITQPFTFAKGAVITRNDLSRYAVLPNRDAIYTRGRYTLTIEVRSIDGIQNDVSVLANVEGRAENGLVSQWASLPSTGVAENEFLIKLVETVTGVLPDGVVVDTDNP